ncbi:uncharacterized protein HMPREF1541_05846 [Cyphellophora europaea CBS 101466]|uniref:Uncharacterized protein n=1 Tax=Cyphellophora europaea (strain CBS 101466) TaxID=1220924 RepID=W2RTH4_CYPE1|nr:uncharacterized protein HMPREF1541_05846 [Cyphellophora europaea CBS 101466]ETN39620.1 hypothetical protein HMPREF1541_05846 [Cyphellophora europaea CBS 101466]
MSSTGIVTYPPSASSGYHSPAKSSLTEQLDSQNAGDRTPRSSHFSATTTPKPRSLSDAPKPALSPSPALRENRRVSKDDSSLALESPTTPRRSTFHARALSLTMPLKDSPSDLQQSTGSSSRTPLSPNLEPAHIYGSPASMLPRRSRGLDYTRACTNLHHSTLAESSPDASPVTNRINIPQRRSLGGSTVLDSPSNTASHMWSTIPERTALSSSVSSVNMLDSDSDSESTSDEDMGIDRESEDPMLNTPAASRLRGNLMGAGFNSPGTEWMNSTPPSTAQSNLMSFSSNLLSFRRRIRKGKSQHSSSSVSIKSSRPSPGPLSPGIVKSVEQNGYFGTGLTRKQVQSRRESLSLGTDELRLSDSEESSSKNGVMQSDMDVEGPRGVIRRAVTRRGNLLPKSKGFARIKAALIEESTPIDSEARREAEVIKQVQDTDPTFSPPINPTSDNIETSIEDSLASSLDKSAPLTFSQHAAKNSAAGLGFWHNNAFGIQDDRYRTPPPTLLPRESSSAVSDEMMDTSASMINTNGGMNGDNLALRNFQRSRSRSTTPLAAGAPTAGDVARRVNNKRRREDDFDLGDFVKRRAVSPGLSVQSSPVLPQSPIATAADKSWGKPPPKANGNGERSNSASSGSNGFKKGVGLQRMDETNDGLMSMSID